MRKVDPQKHADKRRKILQAAEICFVRDGFRGASISDICTEAQMSPGHLYHYFAGKEAIIAAMTDVGLERAAERFHVVMQKSDVVAAFLAEFDDLMRKPRERNPSLILEVIAEASRNPAIAAILQNRSRRLQDLLAAFLHEGQQRGQVDPAIDAEGAAAILVNIVDSAGSLAIKDPGFDLATGTALLKLLIRRFLTPPAAPARGASPSVPQPQPQPQPQGQAGGGGG